jgi:hypothetical protein
MDKKKVLQNYSDEYYRLMYGLHPDMSAAVSYDKAERFLNRFAIDDNYRIRECMRSMEEVFAWPINSPFDIENEYPENLFKPGLHLFAHVSTPLFTEEHFKLIKDIGNTMGDKWLYIIEECNEENSAIAFKFQFPIYISWDELADGGFISDVLLNMHHNNYFLFGDSGKWGRWCDYENSWMDYEIFGYNEECVAVEAYRQWCSLTKEEYKDLLDDSRMPNTLQRIEWSGNY